MKLAMHPDDPQVDSIKGIGRIMNTVDNFKRMLKICPTPSNGITMRQGNFSLMGANIPRACERMERQNSLCSFPQSSGRKVQI
jgi:mannonate dehydratase